jgi:hypothetical protein
VVGIVEAVDRGADHGNPALLEHGSEFVSEDRLPCPIDAIDRDPGDGPTQDRENVVRHYAERRGPACIRLRHAHPPHLRNGRVCALRRGLGVAPTARR